MSFLAARPHRQSRRFSFVAAADGGAGTYVGFDTGRSGMGTFGAPADSATLATGWRLNGAAVSGVFCDAGTTHFNMWFRLSGETSHATVAALGGTQFFERILIKNAAGTVVANMPKASAVYATNGLDGTLRWASLAGATALTPGQTYTVEWC